MNPILQLNNDEFAPFITMAATFIVSRSKTRDYIMASPYASLIVLAYFTDIFYKQFVESGEMRAELISTELTEQDLIQSWQTALAIACAKEIVIPTIYPFTKIELRNSFFSTDGALLNRLVSKL